MRIVILDTLIAVGYLYSSVRVQLETRNVCVQRNYMWFTSRQRISTLCQLRADMRTTHGQRIILIIFIQHRCLLSCTVTERFGWLEYFGVHALQSSVLFVFKSREMATEEEIVLERKGWRYRVQFCRPWHWSLYERHFNNKKSLVEVYWDRRWLSLKHKWNIQTYLVFLCWGSFRRELMLGCWDLFYIFSIEWQGFEPTHSNRLHNSETTMNSVVLAWNCPRCWYNNHTQFYSAVENENTPLQNHKTWVQIQFR